MHKQTLQKLRTLQAIKDSIVKWETLAEMTTLPLFMPGDSQCPLCNLFIKKTSTFNEECRQCPVYLKTGRRYCGSTPYADASDAFKENDQIGFQSAAEAEVEFLKSLLP